MRFWTVLFLLFALVCGVAEAQSLTATPSPMNVTAGIGQGTIQDREVVITNTGTEVQFSAALQPGVNWATAIILPFNSRLPANSSTPAVLLKFNLQGVAQGTHNTTLVVTAVGRPTLNVPVSLSVVPPSITVDPSAPATFTQRLGTVSQYPFLVNYNGPGIVQVALASAQSWISVRPSALEGFPASVSAEVNTTGLISGQVYEATLNFTAPSAPTVPVKAVTVRVLVASSLSVQPKEVTFSGAPGSAASVPPSIQVTVSNFGAATSYTITPSSNAPWLRTSKQSGLLPMNGSDTFEVRTDATNLATTGEVLGTIEIGAPGRPTDIVTVRLQLSGAQDITVSPATLSFAGQAGTPTAAPSQATVTVANSGQATGYTISVDQPSWLVISKNAGTVAQNGTDTFIVTASPQLQTVGTKTGTITVAAPGRAPRSIAVTFNVTSTPPPPDLTVNPTSLAFSAQAGVATSVPASSSVSVGNVGPAVGYTISADQPWVILDKLAGTIPENGSDNFPVRVSGVGQTIGPKTATITITSPGRTARTISVTMTVTTTDPTLDLTVTPGTMTFAGQAGTTTAAPSASTVTVRNVGAATTYTVVVNQPWLTVSKPGGSLADNGTDTFTVSASPQQQTPGTKTGSITVSAPGRSDRTIAVTFTVTLDPPPPDLLVSPSSLSFSAAVGDTTGTPATETVTLTNIGSPVGFALSADQSWIDLPSLSGSITANGTATFTVGVKPQGQVAGTRNGTVSITAPGRPARSIAVVFAVQDTPATADMTVSPSAISFVGQSGTANGIPSSATVTINNAGTPVAYTLLPDQAWMVLSKTSGNLAQGGSDTFTVSANPISQTPGPKTGNITVQAAGRPTRIIPVNFSVSAGEPASELLVVPATMTFTGKANQATASPAKQLVTITNVGAAVGYTLFADKSWVTLNKLAGSIAQNSTDSLEVSVSGVGLAAGTQTATISAAAPGRATKTITVTFIVEAEVVVPTDLTASPTALTYTAVLGMPGGAPSPWKVTLSNVGPATSFLAAPDQPWILLDNVAGTLPADGSVTLLVSVNPSFLPTTGVRSGNILISANNRPSRAVTVTLNLVSQEPPADMVVLPAALTFNQPTGQTVASPTQAMVQVGNVGAPLGYVISADQTWITLSKNSGNISQNGTDSFNVSVNTTGLGAGTRAGTITVSSPGRPNRSIPVTLVIGGSGTQDNMSVTPSTLLTTGRVGDTSTTPTSTTVTVSNTGASVLYAVTPNQSWIVVSKLSGTLPANGTDTFTISAIPSNLATGTYTGTVIVTAPGRPQATINVSMILTVTGQVTRIESFPPQIDFYSQAAFPTLGQALRVTTSDGSTTNVNVMPSSSGWLSTAPGAIATPGQANLTVISSPSNLPLTGSVALVPNSQGILTAEVPVYLRDVGGSYYSIPRIVDGSGFATTITIANLDSAPAIVTLRFRRVLPDSTTITWMPSMENNQSIENVPIPANGSMTWRTRGLGNQAEAGWVQIISAQKIGGFAIFRQSVQGRADQEAAVPVVSSWQQRILIPFDNINNLVTSMAISNVSESENGDVRAIFRDESGQVITGNYRKVLPPQGHTAFALTDELTFLRNRRGTAEFVMIGGRMSALGLRFAASAFTSFEAQSLNVFSNGRLTLPQIANAGGYSTTITLVNKDIVPAVVSMRFYRRTTAQGATENWNLPMVGNQPTQNVTIPPGSSVSWQTTGTGEASSGWAEITTAQQVSGFAVYLQKVAGRFDQEATVPVNIGEQKRFLLPYDNTQPFTTTMALANYAEDTQALVIATVRDDQNSVIGQQIPVIVPVRGHLAFRLADQFPQTVGRRGTIEFSVSFGNISAIGLRFAGEAFTSFRPQVFP